MPTSRHPSPDAATRAARRHPARHRPPRTGGLVLALVAVIALALAACDLQQDPAVTGQPLDEGGQDQSAQDDGATEEAVGGDAGGEPHLRGQAGPADVEVCEDYTTRPPGSGDDDPATAADEALALSEQAEDPGLVEALVEEAQRWRTDPDGHFSDVPELCAGVLEG